MAHAAYFRNVSIMMLIIEKIQIKKIILNNIKMNSIAVILKYWYCIKFTVCDG